MWELTLPSMITSPTRSTRPPMMPGSTLRFTRALRPVADFDPGDDALFELGFDRDGRGELEFDHAGGCRRQMVELVGHGRHDRDATLVEQQPQRVDGQPVAFASELAQHAPFGGRVDLGVEHDVGQRRRLGERLREGAQVGAGRRDGVGRRGRVEQGPGIDACHLRVAHAAPLGSRSSGLISARASSISRLWSADVRL